MMRPAEILLYGEIGVDTTARDVAAQLQLVSPGQGLDVLINSPGGSVPDGVAIISQLKAFTGRWRAIVQGYALSIACAVAASADQVLVSEGSRLMIHKPYAGNTSGTASDLRRTAGVLDGIQVDLVKVFQKRTGKSEAQVLNWMSAETWFSASEAIAAGLADRMTTTGTMRNSFDLAKLGYRNIPAPLLRPRYTAAAALMRGMSK
jgi:ATP-dependent Clp endopeptidase proteolytic subunit ClpP